MKREAQLFVRFGKADNPGTLRRAILVCREGSKVELRVGATSRLRADLPMVLFHHFNGRFYSQQGTIESIVDVSGNEAHVTVRCVGDPCPAESRNAFRAVTVGRNITAFVENEHCEVVNVSAHGLAIVTKQPSEVGAELDIAIEVNHRTVRGRGTVRSCIALARDRFKVGIEVHDRQLSMVLTQLCMSVQREQLKRLARASS